MATTTLPCEGCGAKVTFTESDREAGDIRCASCGGVVRYKESDTSKNESQTFLD